MSKIDKLSMQASNILSSKFGRPISIDRIKVLTAENRRNRITRIHMKKTGDDIPDSLIIKQAKGKDYNPQDYYSQSTVMHFNDWSGVEFLSGLFSADKDRLSPKFYAGDPRLGYIMEDLGDHKDVVTLNGEESEVDASLIGPLLNKVTQPAEEGLMLWMECLGRMHANTIGREKEYEIVRSHLGCRKESSRVIISNWFRGYIKTIEEVCKQIDFTPATGFYDELQQLANTIESPGPFLSFTHGDPCPDNCSLVDGKIRLIDFERGSYQHALFDAVYPRVIFPTCACCNSLPNSIVEKLESAYRTQLVLGCPESADDRIFKRGIVEACAYWTMMLFQILAENMIEDQDWGIATRRQRILSRLDMMATYNDAYQYLPAITETCDMLATKLHKLWPDSMNLPVYPAFSNNIEY